MYVALTGIVEDGSKRSVTLPALREVALARGEDASIVVHVVYPDGRPFDLSGGVSAVFTVKRRPTSDDAELVKTVSTSSFDPSGDPIVTFAIASADTRSLFPGRYVCDVWVTTGGKRYQVVPPIGFVLGPSVAAVP